MAGYAAIVAVKEIIAQLEFDKKPADSKCPHCGAKTSDDMKYCGTCGAKIAEDEV